MQKDNVNGENLRWQNIKSKKRVGQKASDMSVAVALAHHNIGISTSLSPVITALPKLPGVPEPRTSCKIQTKMLGRKRGDPQ